MKQLILLIAMLVFLSASAWAQQSYDVTAAWEHDGAAEFRLYQDDALIATFAGDIRQAQVTIYMVEYQHTFTMTAVDGWGRESAHSVPLVFDAPMLNPPIQLYLQF